MSKTPPAKKKAARTPARPARTFNDQAALSLELTIAPRTLRRLLSRDDCPVNRWAPWTAGDAAKLKKWRGQPQAAADGAGPGGESSIEIQLKTERMRHERLKREILEGQYIRRELLDESLGGLAQVFVDVVTDLELALPPRLAQLTAAQIEAQLGPILDAYRSRIIEKAQYETISVEKIAAAHARRGRGRPTARG